MRSESPASAVVRFGLLALGLAVIGCQAILPPPPPLAPTARPTQPTPTTPATPTPRPLDTGWEPIAKGVEQRIWHLVVDGQLSEQLFLLRLDPAFVRFDVLYAPGEPQSLGAWSSSSGALAVVNGGFFTPEFEATGLIIADGKASGTSYGAFAGMFAIAPEGPEVRWLTEQPYDPEEPLLAAVQNFPMLLKPGGAIGYNEVDELPSRRTVVAQDHNGRIVFLVAAWGSFTLSDLSRFLAVSGLELDTALNLDGGASSGIWLGATGQGVDALSPIPAVVVIYAKE